MNIKLLKALKQVAKAKNWMYEFLTPFKPVHLPYQKSPANGYHPHVCA